MGSLDGLFIVASDVWQVIEGLKWHGHDVLGKHSELWGQIGVEGEWSVKDISTNDLETLSNLLEFNIDEIQPYDGDVMECCQARYMIGGFDIMSYITEGQTESEND